MLRHRCILADLQTKRDNTEVATSPPPSWAPQGAQKCCITLAFFGVFKKKTTKSEAAASPRPSRGPIRGPKCYGISGFWRSPKHK